MSRNESWCIKQMFFVTLLQSFLTIHYLVQTVLVFLCPTYVLGFIDFSILWWFIRGFFKFTFWVVVGKCSTKNVFEMGSTGSGYSRQSNSNLCCILSPLCRLQSTCLFWPHYGRCRYNCHFLISKSTKSLSLRFARLASLNSALWRISGFTVVLRPPHSKFLREPLLWRGLAIGSLWQLPYELGGLLCFGVLGPWKRLLENLHRFYCLDELIKTGMIPPA